MSTIDHSDPTFRQWLLDMLHVGPVSITFTKTDGTEREMNCTLDKQVVPEYQNKTSREKVKNEDVVAVWDLDKQAWRSFRFDSLTRVHIEL